MWDEFMDELRHTHVGQDTGRGSAKGPSVQEQLAAAYDALVAGT
jgi:hypothetical protein